MVEILLLVYVQEFILDLQLTVLHLKLVIFHLIQFLEKKMSRSIISFL